MEPFQNGVGAAIPEELASYSADLWDVKTEPEVGRVL